MVVLDLLGGLISAKDLLLSGILQLWSSPQSGIEVRNWQSSV